MKLLTAESDIQPAITPIAASAVLWDLRRGICLGARCLQGSQDFALEQLGEFNVFGTLGLYYLGEVHFRVFAKELHRVDVRVAANYWMVCVFELLAYSSLYEVIVYRTGCKHQKWNCNESDVSSSHLLRRPLSPG